MQNIMVTIGENRVRVDARAAFTGRGIDVLLTGGESPHVGGVVVCVPRQSTNTVGFSCDTWVVPVTGHKDHLVAQAFGELVCKTVGQVTVVTAGIHIDNASSEELDMIQQNCILAARELIKHFAITAK